MSCFDIHVWSYLFSLWQKWNYNWFTVHFASDKHRYWHRFVVCIISVGLDHHNIHFLDILKFLIIVFRCFFIILKLVMRINEEAEFPSRQKRNAKMHLPWTISYHSTRKQKTNRQTSCVKFSANHLLGHTCGTIMIWIIYNQTYCPLGLGLTYLYSMCKLRYQLLRDRKWLMFFIIIICQWTRFCAVLAAIFSILCYCSVPLSMLLHVLTETCTHTSRPAYVLRRYNHVSSEGNIQDITCSTTV